MKIVLLNFLLVFILFSCNNKVKFNIDNEIVIKTSNNLNIKIDNKDEIILMISILNKIKDAGTPSCPFGNLEIIIGKNESIFYATDDCPMLKYKNKFYYLNDNDNK